KGLAKIRYEHPLLEEVCADTYGVMIYQEQVMAAASRLAGYSLGQADLLRRAMGKKDKEKMAKERANFIEGCARENKIPEKKANAIFDLLEKFAGYGFNKSHSAAYGLISYQTAYLKANYPVEFMAGLLSNEINNTDKISANGSTRGWRTKRSSRTSLNAERSIFSGANAQSYSGASTNRWRPRRPRNAIARAARFHCSTTCLRRHRNQHRAASFRGPNT